MKDEEDRGGEKESRTEIVRLLKTRGQEQLERKNKITQKRGRQATKTRVSRNRAERN